MFSWMSPVLRRFVDHYGSSYDTPGKPWFEKATRKNEFHGRPYLKFAINSNYLKLKKVARVVEAVEAWATSQDYLPKAVSILDVGCGWSVVYARALASLGYQVTGIDLNERHIAEARQSIGQESGIELLAAEGCQFLRETERDFHIILAADTLEHFAEVEEFFALCVRRLHSQGLLLIIVPDGYGEAELTYLPLAYYVMRRLGMKQVAGEPHLQHFSLASLRRLLQSHGLKYRFVGSIFTTRLPFFICLLPGVRSLPAYWNIWLADRLPPFMTSSWLVAGYKQNARAV